MFKEIKKSFGPFWYWICKRTGWDGTATAPTNRPKFNGFILKDIHSFSEFSHISFFLTRMKLLFGLPIIMQQYFIRFHGSMIWNIFFFMVFSVGHFEHCRAHENLCTDWIKLLQRRHQPYWHGVCWNNKKSEKPCSAF